jgi:hypothetical protein
MDAEAAKSEAAARFQRAMQLYRNGNLAPALAELELANEIAPHPVVLFNIGVLRAELALHVEAEAAFEKLLASPGSLAAERVERAKVLLGEQKAMIGIVALDVPVSGAQIEIDGVVVGTQPAVSSVRLATGPHVVGALAPGHAPVRKLVTVAAGATTAVRLDPPVIEGRLAHLTVRTHVPGAEVVVDGEVVARTPLAASISLLPGRRVIELRREGYRTARAELTLDEGATGEVSLDPEEDEVRSKMRGGDLRLDLTESQAVVTVDGRSRGTYVAPLRLSEGAHRILVERGGFRPLVRDVTVAAGQETTLSLALEPTPERRAEHVARASERRIASIVTMGIGAAVMGGAGGFLGWNASNKAEKQSVFDADYALCRKGELTVSECETRLTTSNDAVNQASSLDVVGGVGLGLGGAAIVTGLVVLVSGDDPYKYEARPVERLTLVPTFAPTRGGFSLGFAGSF